MKKKWWLWLTMIHIGCIILALALVVVFVRGQTSSVQTLQDTVRTTVARVSPAVVMIVGEESILGGGVFISPEGMILTSKHLVRRDESDGRYAIRYGDARIAWARVVSLHPTLDLALLRLEEPQTVTPIQIVPSSVLELGDFVMAFWVVPQIPSFVSHFGMLSQTNQSVRVGTTTVTGLLLTDIPFQAGYSGGPLVNLRWELIGIQTAYGSDSRLGWSTPVNHALIRTWIQETAR